MLTGLVVASCGSLIGIDTDHELAPDGTVPTGDDDSGTSSGEADTGAVQKDATAADAEPDTASGPTCDNACIIGAFGTCNGKHLCEMSCNSFCASRVTCPDGQDCLITCSGDACNNVKCVGGKSCTFDCTAGNCSSASCESPTCTFKCGPGSQCENISCTGDNAICNQECFSGAGTTKDCSKPVECCSPDPGTKRSRICPAKSVCL